MKPNYLRAAVMLLTVGLSIEAIHAAKLVECRPVDSEYLMLFVKDGEVRYRDNGEGKSAYTGHDFAEGDDEMVSFGEALHTDIAQQAEGWILSSTGDTAYADGLHPIAIHRKSKVNNADHNWNYKLDHWLFVKLPKPMQEGIEYTLEIPKSTGIDTCRTQVTFDPFINQSEAVHVNIIGYPQQAPIKSADLYLWLGDGGPRDYQSFVGNKVWIVNDDTGIRHEVGEVQFWKKQDGTPEAENRDLTGSPVWNVDFSTFKQSGKYRLVVEEVGSSAPFSIRDSVYEAPFKTSVLGYYYMRIGEPVTDIRPVPRQPRFIPGEDPDGFTIFLTDVDYFGQEWKEHRGDTWDEPHFKLAKDSMFWKGRKPGNPTNNEAVGGHSDALDWDRHLGHVSNAYDLLLGYILSDGKLGNDHIGIRESNNGIPDIVDEARNEVDFWLKVRVGDAYAHGLTNPTREKIYMFQAKETAIAAWANALNCAMLAEAFRISGHEDLKAYYTDEAIKAFEFAGKLEDPQLNVIQEVGDSWMYGRDFRASAAAYLYNVTGDKRWEDLFAEGSLVNEVGEIVITEKRRHQIWATAAYLHSPQECHYPELRDRLAKAVKGQAMERNVRHMETRPSRRTSNNNYWRTAQNVHLVILAHSIETVESERELLEKALLLEADWGLGRNPGNIVEMTGLGSRHIVNCYTSGRNDGSPGMHPGHTPYNNIDPWGGTHNGSNPRWFTDRGYPAWEDGWPQQESHFNNRYSWANAEFTPRQTMRGKTLLYSYLYGLSL